jgi:hypothetical protein
MCGGNETLALKNEQSGKSTWMTLIPKLSILSCNGYHVIKSKQILTIFSFLPPLLSLLH